MQDLRLIGVHEDGGHLLLADEHGARFRVALDDALRAAARHQRPHAGHAPAETEAPHPPREVQALIRAGLSAQEVAERCGWPVEKVHKYEVPILAEREYVAGLARLVRLRPRGSWSQPSPNLAGRVTDRLGTRGVDGKDVNWDAWRQAGSEWTVVLTFPAGGRQRQATWGFDPATHAIHPRDDEARWFSEDDPAPAEVVAREVPVYDVEAEGGVGADSRVEHPPGPADPLDLVTAMRQRTSARSRRGSRRRTAQEAPLPLESDGAHNDLDPAAEVPASEESQGLEVAAVAPPADHLDAPAAASSQPAADVETLDANATDALGEQLYADLPATQDEDLAPAAEDPLPAPAPQRPARVLRNPARVPVPSWDEVILGAKPSVD